MWKRRFDGLSIKVISISSWCNVLGKVGCVFERGSVYWLEIFIV